ncbi:MAG: hypothetical protein KAS12_01720 [Candidatus Aenigmarchaeota archaeon]|nr:hypothetical protein [Candidatus Aenigmarchaeota archaeon]
MAGKKGEKAKATKKTEPIQDEVKEEDKKINTSTIETELQKLKDGIATMSTMSVDFDNKKKLLFDQQIESLSNITDCFTTLILTREFPAKKTTKPRVVKETPLKKKPINLWFVEMMANDEFKERYMTDTIKEAITVHANEIAKGKTSLQRQRAEIRIIYKMITDDKNGDAYKTLRVEHTKYQAD